MNGKDLKELLQSKSRYIQWKSFLIKHNLLFTFENLKLTPAEKLGAVAYRIIHNLDKIPLCKLCSNTVKYHNNYYQQFCSKSCQSKFNTKSRLNTYKKRTGFNSPLDNPEVLHRKQIKTKETCLERYGVTHVWSSPNIRKKIFLTKLEKYNDGTFTNTEKCRKTKLEKYNDIWYSNPVKREQTILEKYGQKHIMQTGLIEIGYKWKDYVLPSGNIIKIQGYENFLLDELLETYSEESIKTSRKDMPEFWYVLDGIKRRYFPDCYIPEINTIYEVKSTYTNKCNEEMNELKFQAVKNAGYNFELKIY